MKFETGYKFKSSRGAYKFLLEIFEHFEAEGVYFFIDDSKSPRGIVILRFSGDVNLGALDETARRSMGERMYLPGDWRILYSGYEFRSIEEL